jgi:hypothetical protein
MPQNLPENSEQKILTQLSYYSDGIEDLPGNGKKQWFKE